MKLNSKLLQLSAAGALALGAVSSAQAVATMTLFESVSNSTVFITDNGVGDSSALTGVVLFAGSIGAFNVTVDTGMSKPVLGSATAPHMDLSFIANSTGPANLTITFSDDGFTYTGSLTDAFGGTAGNNSTVTNSVLKNGVQLIGQGPFTTGGFAATSSSFVSLLPQDILSLRVNIVTTGVGGVSSGDKDVFSAPDNGLTVSLLGSAMIGLIALRRKVRSA